MKKIFPLIAIVSISISGFSQYPGKLVDSVVNYYYTSLTDSLPGSKYEYERNSYEDAVLYAKYYWNDGWIILSSEGFEYDSTGRMNKYLEYTWNGGSEEWDTVFVTEISFDQEGREILRIMYAYHFGDMIPNEKIEQNYDSNGNQTLFAKYSWYSTHWLNLERKEDVYDPAGNITLHLIYDSYNEDNCEKYENTFDPNGNHITRIDYKWEQMHDEWLEDRKDVYTYNANGTRTSWTRYKSQTGFDTWKEESKYEYSLDAEDNVILQAQFAWYGFWENHAKKEMTWDENGNMITEAIFHRDFEEEKWTGDDKYEYFYNANNYLTKKQEYYWLNDSTWVMSLYEEYTYDDGNNIIDRSVYIANGMPWEKTEYTYDSNGQRLSLLRYKRKNDWEGIMIKSYLDEYTYDSIARRTSDSRLNWSEDLSKYTSGYKHKYLKNSVGNELYNATYSWDSDIQDWILVSERVSEYDENEFQTLNLFKRWVSSSNEWTGYRRETTYDSRGFKMASRSFEWDDVAEEFIKNAEGFAYRGFYLLSDTDSICNGEELPWQNGNYNTEGTYRVEYKSVSDRDSIHELELSVLPGVDPYSITGKDNVAGFETVLYSAPVNASLVYQWQTENGNVISIPASNTVQVQWGGSGEGIISGIATNEYGCSNSSSLTVTIINTDVQTADPFVLQIYPNPASDLLIVENATDEDDYRILDMNGLVLLRGRISGKVEEIDISCLISGIYYLSVNNKSWHPFIKE